MISYRFSINKMKSILNMMKNHLNRIYYLISMSYYLQISCPFIIFIHNFFDNSNNVYRFGKIVKIRSEKKAINQSFRFQRETRSIPGNECLTGDKSPQHIGDLIVNLIEILPVRENRRNTSIDYYYYRLFLEI